MEGWQIYGKAKPNISEKTKVATRAGLPTVLQVSLKKSAKENATGKIFHSTSVTLKSLWTQKCSLDLRSLSQLSHENFSPNHMF